MEWQQRITDIVCHVGLVVMMVPDSWELPSHTAGELYDLDKARAGRTPRPSGQGMMPSRVVPFQRRPSAPEPSGRGLADIEPYDPAKHPGYEDEGPTEIADERSARSVEDSGFEPVGVNTWRRKITGPDNEYLDDHYIVYRPGFRRGDVLAPWHLTHDPDSGPEGAMQLRSAGHAIKAANQQQESFQRRSSVIPDWTKVGASSPDDFYRDLYGGNDLFTGTDEDPWHRFSVLPHPSQPDDRHDIGISVKQLPDEPGPWGGDSGGPRTRWEWNVHKNGEPVITGQPFWGPVRSYGDIDHEEVARSVAHDLGSDSHDLGSLGTPDHDLSTPENIYHGTLGKVTYGDDGKPSVKSVPYTRRQGEFLQEHGHRLFHAGREYPYEYDNPEESTLVPWGDTSKGSDLRAVNEGRAMPYERWRERYGSWRDWTEL